MFLEGRLTMVASVPLMIGIAVLVVLLAFVLITLIEILDETRREARDQAALRTRLRRTPPPVPSNTTELLQALQALQRHWIALILAALQSRSLRHGELCQQVCQTAPADSIEPRALNDSLLFLLATDLVIKYQEHDDTQDSYTVYSLTAAGASLHSALRMFSTWAEHDLPADDPQFDPDAPTQQFSAPGPARRPTRRRAAQ